MFCATFNLKFVVTLYQMLFICTFMLRESMLSPELFYSGSMRAFEKCANRMHRIKTGSSRYFHIKKGVNTVMLFGVF